MTYKCRRVTVNSKSIPTWNPPEDISGRTPDRQWSHCHITAEDIAWDSAETVYDYIYLLYLFSLFCLTSSVTFASVKAVTSRTKMAINSLIEKYIGTEVRHLSHHTYLWCKMTSSSADVPVYPVYDLSFWFLIFYEPKIFFALSLTLFVCICSFGITTFKDILAFIWKFLPIFRKHTGC